MANRPTKEVGRQPAEHRAYPEVVVSLGGKVVGSEAPEAPDKTKTMRAGRRSDAGPSRSTSSGRS